MENRTIIHLDLDAFYCAVEELSKPHLKGKPFAVGGSPASRGVVSSCSYAARRRGIRSAMPMARAVQLCPDLIVLPGNHREYSKKSKQVMAVLKEVTNLVEQISIDEAFLDISAISEKPLATAHQLQQDILQKTRLPCSLGIASNKLVAKIATDIGKSSVETDIYPNALLEVPAGKESEFLSPLPLETLWGIGPKTADALRAIGINNIGQLAKWPTKDLVNRFGKHGYDLHRRANGIDNRPVETVHEPKSFSQEVTFSRDTNDEEVLAKQLSRQAASIAESLSRRDLVCTTVKLKLRWPDFSTITRQTTLVAPTADRDLILSAARDLFDHHWNNSTPIRLIGVGVSGLQPPNRQLSLWDQIDFQKVANLEAAIHQVRARFGPQMIQKGASKSPLRKDQ
jgi:DNA polymerase-4